MKTKLILMVMIGVIVCGVSIARAGLLEYEIIDLGNFGFSDGCYASSINNFGQITIVGHSGGNYSSFLYDDGVVTNLGGNATRAYAINDNAIIVGQSEISGVSHAFIYENGSMTFIGGASEGRDINQYGQIICQNGLIYDNGVTIELPKPIGYESWSWYAEAINDNGDVTGYLRTPDFPHTERCAFSYVDGIISILNVPNNGMAFDINNSGQIVGTFGLWENGVITHSTSFDAINNAGQMVGGEILYEGENNINLNTLISPSLGWELTRAYCINDNGWIVGEGINPDGDFHVFLLTPEPAMAGYIVAWGRNDDGQCNIPDGNDFVSVAGSYAHSLALRSDGSLIGWGWNVHGQCDVPESKDFAAIAAATHDSLALKSDGSLIAWGANHSGHFNVPTGNDFVKITTYYEHSLALKSDGSLVAWGWNDHGQCNVPTGNDFVDISVGDGHSLALKSNGSLAVWGDNRNGQCDNLPLGSDFIAVTGGGRHSLALRSNGSIAAWGYNEYGQCDVPTGYDFVAIAAGQWHSLALKDDGKLVAWGYNGYGQCDVPDSHHFVAIAAGFWHNLAIAATYGGYIDWTDLAAFCDRWMDDGCSDANDWCGRADINRNTVVDSTDYSWLAKYWASIAPEPNAAGNPEPQDSATEVSITADLSWAAGADAAAHGVYFGISPTLDANDFQGYQTGAIFNPGTMAADTTYYWQVDEVGLGGETSGEVWSFTTAPVPGKAYNPSPSDLATNININHNLSWTANFYTTSHDVYFGTNPTPGAGEFEGNQTSTTFDPGTLDYETTYYWRIDGVGPGGTTTGVVWSFTTEATPVPGQAGNPVPANMATDVNITTCLNWTAGANTTSHDVYFGTNPIPDINDLQGNQTTTSFCPPSSLEYSITYYWRIDEKNPYNTTTGEVWSFTTMVDPNLVGWWKFDETSGVIAYDSSGKENHGQLVDGIGNGLVWAPAEGALNFDGSNNLSRVVVSTVGMSTTAGTIAIWANLAEPQNRGDGRNGSGYFFGCDNGVKDRILLYMDNSNTQLDVRIGDHSETNIITLGTLVWYHIALTWNSGSYVVHLNGSEIATGTYSGLTTLPSTADIGNNGGSYKQSFHGLMGDVQVYDKSLSTVAIQRLYQDVAD